MQIKVLSDKAINRIAAGEVIARPISVVKELVENAIDALASKIEINFIRGGRTLISVSDNGSGIPKDQLALSLARHATSKIQEDDIDNIAFFGFRGEALASIAAVGIISITSKIINDNIAWKITSSNPSEMPSISPAKREVGTTIELADLFCFTPNRIKFLKSESAENIACTDLIRRFALCFPKVAFKLIIDNKIVFNTVIQDDSDSNLIENLLGQDFIQNTISFQHEEQSLSLNGHIGFPTFNHATALKQYYFVNNRVVKDKILATAVKIAYSDLIPHGKHPALVFFLNCPNDQVDVNVHPTKSEVRFSDERLVQKVIINAIRSNISNQKLSSSNIIKPASIIKMIDSTVEIDRSRFIQNTFTERPASDFIAPPAPRKIEEPIAQIIQQNEKQPLENHLGELGEAIYQIDNTYIVATAQDGLIIVDQHAAHERIVLESMKKQLLDTQVQSERLLIPVIISYDKHTAELIMENKESLASCGLLVDKYGISDISIYGIPSLFKNINLQDMLDKLIEGMKNIDQTFNIKDELLEIYGNIACKNSVKAGRKLSIMEMNALLREMERTEFVGQCNHGRPTYIKINTITLSKLFERT